jgi:hypothetical protein
MSIPDTNLVCFVGLRYSCSLHRERRMARRADAAQIGREFDKKNGKATYRGCRPKPRTQKPDGKGSLGAQLMCQSVTS